MGRPMGRRTGRWAPDGSTRTNTPEPGPTLPTLSGPDQIPAAAEVPLLRFRGLRFIDGLR